MPSDRNTAYPFLEQMRTEELEALLQQEFTAADGGEPDVDYIMAIMEVMKQRDANPPAAEVDVDAAWRDFKENYQGQASAYETEVLPERDSSHLDQITSPSRTGPRRPLDLCRRGRRKRIPHMMTLIRDYDLLLQRKHLYQ